MLILLYNLYSLLFLLKNDINDIIFIEYSNRIACSNRVKQRCIFRLRINKYYNTKECYISRRRCIFILRTYYDRYSWKY